MIEAPFEELVLAKTLPARSKASKMEVLLTTFCSGSEPLSIMTCIRSLRLCNSASFSTSVYRNMLVVVLKVKSKVSMFVFFVLF